MGKEAPVSRALTIVRSLLFMLLFYGLTIPLLAAAVIACLFGSHAIGAVGELWAALHRLLARVVLGQRVVVEGELPQAAQFIVIKHESMFETLDTICLFKRPVVAAKRELIQIPIWGWVAARYGLIAVDRKAGASALRAIRTQALDAMAKGRAVIFFPEGTRVPHGAPVKLTSGGVRLACATGALIVPVVHNAGKVWPAKGWPVGAGDIRVVIGPTLSPAERSPQELSHQVHDWMQAELLKL